MNVPQPLLLELGMSQCVICGKDAETCEHSEPQYDGELADHETDAERNR